MLSIDEQGEAEGAWIQGMEYLAGAVIKNLMVWLYAGR